MAAASGLNLSLINTFGTERLLTWVNNGLDSFQAVVAGQLLPGSCC
jgi:hypothetical protein